MRTTPLRLRAVLPFLVVALSTACGSGSAGSGEPDTAIDASVKSLEEGKPSEFFKRALSKAQYDEMRAEWEKSRAEAPDPEDAAQFSMVMSMLTAKDAEANLFTMVRPQLAELQQQAVGFVGMASMFAGMAGDQAETANKVLADVQARIPQMGLADEQKAKSAIAAVTGTARKLGLSNLDAAYQLEFPELMKKVDILYRGVTDVLEIYGLSVKDTLESMEFKVAGTTGDRAKVDVSYSVFGGPKQSTTLDMQQVDGRWVVPQD